MTRALPTALAVLIAGASAAQADTRPRSVGFYAEAGIGGQGFLGDAAEHSALGPAMSLHVGYDLFAWLSVGGRLGASTHEATVPPPPEGEFYQLYSGAAEARLGVPIGPIAVFADGSLGLAMISTNVLVKVDILDPGEKYTPIFSAGGGLEYQLQNRHYALGVAAAYTVLPAFASSQAVGVRAYLRYTY